MRQVTSTIRSLQLVTIVLLAALLFVATMYDKAEAAVMVPSKSIDLAEGHNVPEGIWSDGSTMWIVEGREDKILAYSMSTQQRQSGKDIELASYNDDPQGIWSDGTVMWVADWDDTKLYGYSLSNGQRLSGRDIDLTGRNDGPRGVWGHGSFIYVVDKDDTWVYAYNKSNRNRASGEEFNLHSHNQHPWGIWGDGTNVWISDFDDGMLYAYTTNTSSYSDVTRDESLEVQLTPLHNSNHTSTQGIWSDGTIMWFADIGDTAVYAMYHANFRQPDNDISFSAVTTPRGLWTNGETMWVVEAGSSDSKKLYAYNLATGNREASNDVRLASNVFNPYSIWSDGTTIWVVHDGTANDFLFAHELDQDAEATQLLVPNKSITLDLDNSAPRGVWSDGDTVWVLDADDEKLYGYDLALRTRKSSKDFDLHPANSDPIAIWSDGETMWVLDNDEMYVYAYDLPSLRVFAREFWPVWANENPTGITGYRGKVWMTDYSDKKAYAYTKLNAQPTFSESSASLSFHYTLGGDSYIGTLPEAVDPDEDSLTYSLEGDDADKFTVNQSREVYTATGATFSGGDEYTLTAAVSDGKTGLDSSDESIDDSINLTIEVIPNSDPVIDLSGGRDFYVPENLQSNALAAQLDVSDADGDSLFVLFRSEPGNAFRYWDEKIFLRADKSLNYEQAKRHRFYLRIRDNKNDSGGTDSSWDIDVTLRIHVTNVEEEGSITLSSTQPVEGDEIVASVNEPDGVDLSDDRQINWVLSRNSDLNSNNWTEISNTSSDSKEFTYTPVEADVGHFLQFKAVYRDKYDNTQERSAYVNADNAVVAAPTNGAPVFDEGTSAARSLSEDAESLANVGDPVEATDPDSDTITYGLDDTMSGLFKISSTGQIQVDNNATLDFETTSEYVLRAWVSDSKDIDGNDDGGEIDSYIDVTVTVTDVDEDGEVELSSDSPLVDTALVASLIDPDGTVGEPTWQWQKADTFDANTWTDLNDATASSYTPVPDDAGKFLRALASYDDNHGDSKQAHATASNAVLRVDNQPPAFDEGETATRELAENAGPDTRVGSAVSATDPEGDTLTYSLSSGSDSGKFEIDALTGRITVAEGAVLDYEAASSLEVTVNVADGKDGSHGQDDSVDDTLTLTINLENIDEPAQVTFSTTTPLVDSPIVATLTDADGGETGLQWQWQRSSDGVTGWTVIGGNTTDTYTPTADDLDMYLRALVEYTDAQGSGKTAEGMSENSVQEEEPVDTGLQALTLSGVSLTFDKETLLYTVGVANSVDATTVTATPVASSGVEVAISPSDSDTGATGHQVDLAEGLTVITITVSETGGSASTTYTIQVTRLASQSDPQSQEEPNNEEQVEPESTPADDCRSDEDSGLIAHCDVYDFAIIRVEHDGSYNIDWSEWDSENTEVTGYMVVRKELIYKTFHKDGARLSDGDLANTYESCQFADGKWTCEGPLTSNNFFHWDGQPTQILELANDEDITEWSSSLEEPGLLVREETFHRWSGDETDPNNGPGTVTMTTKSFEMDLYYFQIYAGSRAFGREVLMVNGAHGFDMR